MNKDSLEHISSLMDGELSHETSLFVARRMGSDQQLGETWARYHLMRECLRRPGGKWALTRLSLDLDGIDAEYRDAAASLGALPGWLRPVSGLAIAASVAFVTLLLAFPGAFGPAPEGSPQAQPFTSPNPLTAVPVTQPASFSGAPGNSSQRLNTYLLRHNQVAGAAGRQGFVSFVPIVTAAPVQVVDPEELSTQETPAEAGNDDPNQP